MLQQNDISHGVRHVNICDTVKLLVGILQCNGGKLEEAEDFKCVFCCLLCVRIEDFKCVFVVYCVLESK